MKQITKQHAVVESDSSSAESIGIDNDDVKSTVTKYTSHSRMRRRSAMSRGGLKERVGTAISRTSRMSRGSAGSGHSSNLGSVKR